MTDYEHWVDVPFSESKKKRYWRFIWILSLWLCFSFFFTEVNITALKKLDNKNTAF